MKLALYLAVKSVFRTERRFPRLLGVTVSIALSLVPLVVVLEVSDGMIDGIMRRNMELGSGHIRINPDIQAEAEQIRTEVAGADGVVSAAIETDGFALISADRGRTAVQIRGLEPELYERDPGVRRYLTFSEGAYDLMEPDSILLGRESARLLDVSVGDRVKLITVQYGEIRRPRIRSFVVRGVFSSGYQELDRLWVMIPYDSALDFLQDDGGYSFITVKTEDPYSDISAVIRSARDSIGTDSAVNVFSWRQINGGLLRNYEFSRSMLVLIMFLIVAVAAVNVSSSVHLLINERTREIAVLKAVGASPGLVVFSHLFMAAVAGGIGIIAGLAAGVFLSVNFDAAIRLFNNVVNVFLLLIRSDSAEPFALLNSAYYLDQIDVSIDPRPLFGAALVTLGIVLTAALIPSLRAGRIRPAALLGGR